MKFEIVDAKAMRADLKAAAEEQDAGPSRDAILMQIETDYIQTEATLADIPKGEEGDGQRADRKALLALLESRHAAVLATKTDEGARTAYFNALADERAVAPSEPA